MNTSLSFIEICLVGGILILQTSIALRTYARIRRLKSIIPYHDFFKVKKYDIPLEHLQSSSPKDILKNLSTYISKKKEQEGNIYSQYGLDLTGVFVQQPEEDEIEDESRNEVSLINPDEETNVVFDNILLAINVYLLRNKGAATDFNLIKDIVERNVEAEEEDIKHTVTVPLYLGLMGTMIGIVFGLIHLFLFSSTNTDFDIKPFLGGVSIAMLASFWGLFCTIVNANFNVKAAKRRLERAKNDFYTFLQIELLPILNQSISSSVHALHDNLVRFNNNFTLNLNRLTGLLNKNHDALLAQDNILQTLDNLNITEFAKANVLVLKELRTGTGQLEKFNAYLNGLNSLAMGANNLTASFTDMLNRTNNFQGLAEKLDQRVEDNNKLVQFLNNHFQQLESRSKLIQDSLIKVDDIMAKSLQQLQEHTQTKIDSIKQITIHEEDLMTKAFIENRSHISKLSLLEELNKNIADLKLSSASQLERIKNEATNNNAVLENINEQLNRLNETYKNSGLTGALRKSWRWLTIKKNKQRI